MYEDYTIYGPYKRSDGRQHVVLVSEENRITVSYPKYLVELELQRYLTDEETVDHIDGDFTNNDLSNLQVLNRDEHCALDAQRQVPQDFECPLCTTSFTLSGTKLSRAKSNRKKGKAGPFCSRSCAGRYGAYVQTGQFDKLEPVGIEDVYYSRKKSEPYGGNPVSAQPQVGETSARNGGGDPELADE